MNDQPEATGSGGGSAAATPQSRCPHCGGNDVLSGVRAGSGHPIGLQYSGIVLTGAEPLFADLCRACGTVTRLWVRRLDREWSTIRN